MRKYIGPATLESGEKPDPGPFSHWEEVPCNGRTLGGHFLIHTDKGWVVDRGHCEWYDCEVYQLVTKKDVTREEFQKAAGDMIQQIRDENQDIIDEMPDVAATPGQEELKAKHGTPREFARAAVNAIGEISCLEAITSIYDYKARWDAA